MAVQGAAQREGWTVGAEMPDRLTPRQTFCGPLLSAMLFRDWESNPLERRLARWHTSLARAINDFVRVGVLREQGHARWSLTEKGVAVAREFGLISRDGVLIDRALLRKQLVDLALEFEKMYRVVSRPGPMPTQAVAFDK
jgi:hypothetical protein